MRRKDSCNGKTTAFPSNYQPGPSVRARNIKPGFFQNEDLAECSFPTRLLFAGLWCKADRDGLLEDRPKRIKAEIFPYDDLDVGPMLSELEERGFIERYEVNGLRCIRVTNFLAHQKPHKNESPSRLPHPDDDAEYRVMVDQRQTMVGQAREMAIEARADSHDCHDSRDSHDSLKCAEAPHDIQSLVAFYVDHHVTLGRTKPDKRRVGLAAKTINEQLALGAKPEVLTEALRRLVAEAKSPAMLGLKVADVEKDLAPKAAHTFITGRSKHGEF